MPDLPYPSRHEHGHDLFRAYLVGQRNRWRQDVSEGTAPPDGGGSVPRHSNANPEGASVRGLWNDEKFLENVGSPEFNKQLKTTQFADFHGTAGCSAPSSITTAKGIGSTKMASESHLTIPTALGKPCIWRTFIWKKECSAMIAHFAQDNHGNGKIYGEPRAGRRNRLHRCHGTIRKKAALVTSGPAAPEGGRHLDALPFGPRGDCAGSNGVMENCFKRSMSEVNKEVGDRPDDRHHHAG